MQNIADNTNWKIKRKNYRIEDSILIVGLPGIGNVGKISVDFLVDELKAVEYVSFFSYSFPHSVFVTSDNLVELPSICMYHKKRKGKPDLLFLTGDLQPTTERSCYAFCQLLDTLAKELNVSKIFTLGGIGFKEEAKQQHLYVAGNHLKEQLKFNKKHKVTKKAYGSVGPIIGVSGVLAGISTIPTLILLTETVNHPLFIGVDGAKLLLTTLSNELSLSVDVSLLDKELKKEEEKLDRTKKLSQLSENTSYIG